MTSELDEINRRIAELEAAAKPKPAFVPTQYQRIDPLDRLSIPQSAFEDLARVVPDKLVRAIVGDHRGKSGPAPTGMAAEAGRRGSGWQDERPLEPPPGQKIIEAMMDEADRRDRQALAERLARAGLGAKS